MARLWTRMGNGVWTLPEVQNLFPFRNPKAVAGQLLRAHKRGRFQRWRNPEWVHPPRNRIGGWLWKDRLPMWLYRRAGEEWWVD